MPVLREPSNEAALDLCIDCLLAGQDWSTYLPANARSKAELQELMRVAATVARVASGMAHIEKTQQVRVWNRIEARMTTRQGRLRAIALYRLPYLPPLWIRPEAV